MTTSSNETDTQGSSLFSYKGSVSGLKGMLTNKLAEGIASVVSSLDRMTDSDGGEKAPNAQSIPIEQIYPNPEQPRQVFEPRALEELSMTMKELGQAQAITVRKTDEGYEIIAGERRYRAAKLAGLTHLDCVVKDCSPREARLLALVENIQRQDLLPIEEAQFLKRILEENSDLSLEKLAKVLGSHKSTLSEKIQLTEIPEDLQPMLFARGKAFTHRHWRVISRIDDPTFMRQILSQALEHQLSVAELERSLSLAGVKKAPRRQKRLDSDAALSLLSEEQMRSLSIVKREGKTYRIQALTLDAEKVPKVARDRLIAELEEILSSLKSGEVQTESQQLT